MYLNKIFSNPKPIIGMLHLGYLLGQKDHPNLTETINLAKKDIYSLQNSGIDGILIENWCENSNEEFVSPETLSSMVFVVSQLVKHIKVPFGVNVLNNDYKAALLIAKLTNASFVQLDVFVDKVKSDFSYSNEAIKNPFIINPKPDEINKYANKIGASHIPLFVFIQPKHYRLLERNKPIEKSAKQAINNGASSLIVTKMTGISPSINIVKKVKKVSGNVPVGVGSGLSLENIIKFLPVVDFGIVGSNFKVNGVTNNPVDPYRVKQFIETVAIFRKKL